MAQKFVIKANQAYQDVLNFQPQKLISDTSKSIKDISELSEKSSGFRISEVVRSFTGLAEIEDQKIEKTIEKRALEELKKIQEQAYSEAFELGMSDGRHQAFLVNSNEIKEKLEYFEKLISSIKELKVHTLNSNENHFLKLIYFLASKVALFEISERSNEAILSVLRDCVKAAYQDESIRVNISPSQIEFLETIKKEQSRGMDFLKNVDFFPDENIDPGGCVILTNYSEVDARIQERVNKLWDILKDSIPPTKDELK